MILVKIKFFRTPSLKKKKKKTGKLKVPMLINATLELMASTCLLFYFTFCIKRDLGIFFLKGKLFFLFRKVSRVCQKLLQAHIP